MCSEIEKMLGVQMRDSIKECASKSERKSLLTWRFCLRACERSKTVAHPQQGIQWSAVMLVAACTSRKQKFRLKRAFLLFAAAASAVARTQTWCGGVGRTCYINKYGLGVSFCAAECAFVSNLLRPQPRGFKEKLRRANLARQRVCKAPSSEVVC